MAINENTSAAEMNELLARLDVLSNVITIMMAVLNENSPTLHAEIALHIEKFAENMRCSLGQFDETDTRAYAHRVANGMEEYIPLTEREISQLERYNPTDADIKRQCLR